MRSQVRLEKRSRRRPAAAGRARPEWSPDGKWIAFLEGEERKYGRLQHGPARTRGHRWQRRADAGQARLRISIAASQRRASAATASRSRFSSPTIDRSIRIAVDLGGGAARTADVSAGRGLQLDRRRRLFCGASGSDTKPNEIYAGDGTMALVNSPIRTMRLLAELKIGQTEEVSFKSKDGTEVHGLADVAGRLRRRNAGCRCCCGFTAARTDRTSIRSASSGSCSRRTATRCWR